MIASISGTVLFLEEDAVVVETAGVGYRVLVPECTRASLREGQKVHLLTHLIVGQNQSELTLVGFETREELEVFRLLLGVSGVGPKVALAVGDALSPEVLRSAVANEQAEALTRVPGIGLKTARRIILELKDKFERLGVGAKPLASEDVDLIEALTSLGYSLVEAQSAVQALPREGSFEERLRLALARFAH